MGRASSCFQEKSGEHRLHLLEAERDLVAAFFSGVGDDIEVRRADLNPSGVGGVQARGRQSEKEENRNTSQAACALRPCHSRIDSVGEPTGSMLSRVWPGVPGLAVGLIARTGTPVPPSARDV